MNLVENISKKISSITTEDLNEEISRIIDEEEQSEHYEAVKEKCLLELTKKEETGELQLFVKLITEDKISEDGLLLIYTFFSNLVEDKRKRGRPRKEETEIDNENIDVVNN